MESAKLAAVAACVLWALGACGSCGAPSSAAAKGPSQAELASAAIGGASTLAVKVVSYSGPPPQATNRFQPGHVGTDKVTFVSTCAATCTLQMWGPGGPDQSQASYYAFYSSTTPLLGPPVSTPMTESGATYSQTIPIGGFGGLLCPPSRTVPRPEQRLSLTVTAATPTGSRWSATAISGEETLLSGWGCGSGGFTGWTIGHLTISGKAG